MSSDPKPPPPEWGDDELTEFLDIVRENQFATFHQKRSAVNGLIRIDNVFKLLIDGAVNLKPWFPAQFMLRAHGAFKTASASAMAGQIYEINAVLRICLELAAYGLYIGSDSKRAETWLRRHDDKTAKARMTTEFQIRRIKDHILDLAPKVAQHFDKLYSDTIDYGGHPNERGFSSSMNIVDGDERKTFQTIYLQKDPVQFDIALKRTGQVGLWALIACQLLWKERFQLLGLREEVDQLRLLY